MEGDPSTGTISENMVRSVERYPSETIVVVHAKLRKAPKRVNNASIHDYELEVYEIHKVTSLTENVPFTVYDAENISRDREDIEDDEDENATLSDETPRDTPRTSQDTSRVSPDKLSRSEWANPRPNCTILKSGIGSIDTLKQHR